MNLLETIIFPDTNPFRDRLFPLLLLCAPLHFLQLVENENGTISKGNISDRAHTDPYDIFMKQGLCQGHTPAPLGKDRERFLTLIHDIQNRKDEYKTQLSALTIAELSKRSSGQTGDEKRTRIVSSLLNGGARHAGHRIFEQNKLWKQRLLLALAETADREADELQVHLEQIDDQHRTLFHHLRGASEPAEDDPFSLLEAIRDHSPQTTIEKTEKRFCAWLELMKQQPLPPHQLWLAPSRDNGELILERYRVHADETAVPLITFSLPARINISYPHLVNQISAFHQAASAPSTQIVTGLCSLASATDDAPGRQQMLPPQTIDQTEKWQLILEEYFPETYHGRSALTIHLLPHRPIPELLGLDDPKVPKRPQHGLLAIYE